MKKYDTVIGIDTGITGALAEVRDGRLRTYKMPRTNAEIDRLLRDIESNSKNAIAIVEKIFLRPSDMKDGRVFRMQKLLSNYNTIITLLDIIRIDYVEVAPKSWQDYMKFEKIIDYASRKRRNKKEAQKYARAEKITIQKADAVLLSVFGLKKLSRQPDWIEERLIVNNTIKTF